MGNKADVFKQALTAAQGIQQTADDIFGGGDRLGAVDAGRKVLRAIPLEDILPDPRQPRRVLPKGVRELWDGTSRQDSIRKLFDGWMRAASKSLPDNVVFYMSYGRLLEWDEELPIVPKWWSDAIEVPVFGEFIRLTELARNIRKHGLDNPIKVYPVDFNQWGVHHMAESGERRWWGHWLLYIHTEDARWSKITAEVKSGLDVWMQASENTQREQLGGIAMARQFALLLMSLYEEQGRKFEPITAFENEHDFYAQVADSDVYRIIRNTGGKLVNAMGLRNEGQLRFCRQALNLPSEVWSQADEEGWSLSRIREVFEKPKPASTRPRPLPLSKHGEGGKETDRENPVPTSASAIRDDVEGVVQKRVAEIDAELEKIKHHDYQRRLDLVAEKDRLLNSVNNVVAVQVSGQASANSHQEKAQPHPRPLSKGEGGKDPVWLQGRLLTIDEELAIRHVQNLNQVWKTRESFQGIVITGKGLDIRKVIEAMIAMVSVLEVCPIEELSETDRVKLVDGLAVLGDKLTPIYEAWGGE